MKTILWIWVAALLIGALIPIFKTKVWWLRAWTYARLQIFWLTVATCAGFLLFRKTSADTDKWIIVICAFIILVCLRDILVFTKLFPRQSRQLSPDEAHTPLSLIVGNVLMDNDQCSGLMESIETHKPDIVFLAETDEAWRKRLQSLETEYPHTHHIPLPDYNGMLLYSRFPLKNVQERYLVQDHIPSITADIIIDGHTIRFFGVHPRPPRPEDDTADLDKELDFIAHEAGHSLNPVIVTGDLNDVGWSSTTRKFLRTSGLQDPRRGRALFNSYNAKIPFIRWPLDHIFHSREFSLINMKRLPAFGSDHFPIYIKLGLVHP